ncbi:hypothetical protein EV702DRAFT_1266528 [Suillus placidus]|uniref:Uncharacterized protein n=1 Tax=Suillus placidus TaxID=48579 RepID=A0A9P7D5X7_9AGAM|nr:hypothetical protein EV702DRAFT_1266528 [Suillus placidus]
MDIEGQGVADATGGGGFIKEAHDDPYNNFFQQSLPSPGSHVLFSTHRFWKRISRRRPPPDESVPPERSKHGLFGRSTRSDSPLESATLKTDQPVSEGKVGKREGEQGVNADDVSSVSTLTHRHLNPTAVSAALRTIRSAPERIKEGKQRGDPPPDTQSLPSDDPTPPTELDSADNRNIWKRIMRSRGKDPTSVEITPTIQRPEIVEISAVRGFERLVVMKRVRKTKLPKSTCSIPLVAPHASSSSPAGPSPQGGHAQPGPSSQASPAQPGTSSLVSVQAGPSSYTTVGHAVQSSQASPSSHFPTPRPIVMAHADYYGDSSSSIKGSCNRFLDRICFPRGHFH